MKKPSQTLDNSAALPNNATFPMVKRLACTYLAPYLGWLFGAVAFMAIAAAMTAGIAFMLETVLDDVFYARRKDLIAPVAGALMGLFWVSGVSTYIHNVLMAKVGQSIVADLQKELFSHFLVLDLAFFHNNPSGQLISRVINDVQVIRSAISRTLTGIGKNLLTLFFLTIVMFIQDWKLAIAAFVILPFIAGFVAYLGKRLRKISKDTLSEMGDLSGRLSQIFQGIRQVKAYGREDFESKRAYSAIDKVKKLNIKTVRIGSLSTPVNEILVGLVIFGIITYGGTKISAGQMSAGELVSFLAAFIMAYEPMKKLAKLNNTMQLGLGSAERILAMLDLDADIKNSPNARPIKLTKPSIEFKNVDFMYDGADTKALKEINFTAPSGKVTALVGRSGGGKSTILNLIPRFYDVTAGEVIIEDQTVTSVTLQSVRQNIALVSQDITIFDDTIGANIAYGDLEADEVAIQAAAKDAAAHEFIMEMPDGYNTRVGEDGVKLSGGQRQRLSIARAILRDAPILLLDEATSALDNESEKLVQEALMRLEEGRTTIVIAHRLSTVQSADQIIVLDEGQIIERGTHKALMKKAGHYKAMVESGLKE